MADHQNYVYAYALPFVKLPLFRQRPHRRTPVLIDDLGGDALRDLVRTRVGSRGTQSLVGVRMNVNETWRDIMTLHVNHAIGRRPRKFSASRERSLLSRD